MVKFIKEKMEVEEADKARGYARGDKREDYPAGWGATGNVILLGLPGSGKARLAGLVAEKTGQTVVEPADWAEAEKGLAGQGVIAVLDDTLVDSPDKGPVLQQAGKVFFLMADAQTLAQRLVGRDDSLDMEETWEAIGARLEAAQPLFFGMIHFVLQGVRPADQLLGDVMEKLSY